MLLRAAVRWVMTVIVWVMMLGHSVLAADELIDSPGSSPVLSTPFGTVLAFRKTRILLPGVNLPVQVRRVLGNALVTIITRRIAHHLLAFGWGYADKFLDFRVH